MSAKASTSPIFVFGSPRSGTSLVSRILNSHPRIAVPYESLLYSTFYPIRAAYGDLGNPNNIDRLIKHILRWGPMTEWKPRLTFSMVRDRLSRCDFHGVFEAVLTAWALGQGKPRWGEKSPWHAFYWRPILEGFPDAYVVHVVRDVRDATLSWKRARQGPRNTYVLARRWAEYIDTMEGVRAALLPSRFYELRYERLLARPEAIVRDLCAFLEEPFDESMFDFHRDRSAYPTDDTNLVNLAHPILKDNTGKWRTQLSNRELRSIEAAAAPQMVRLGYEPSLGGLKLGLGERLWFTAVEHPISRIGGMLQDQKGQWEGLQKLWFPVSARLHL